MGEEQFRPGCDRRDDSAECVMLNKAPHILDAVATLADILGPDDRPPRQEEFPAATEIDGDETELEIEIKWTDDPSDDAEPDAAPATTDPAPTPAAVEPADDPVPAPEKPTPPRRGRPRKVAAT